MKHGIGRKLLSVVLAVMMLVSLLPTAAFADEISSYSAKNIVVNDVVDDSNTGNDTEPADEAPNAAVVNESEGEESTAITTNEELAAAINAADNGATITLGEGTFTTCGNTSPNKSLTFVGAGTGKTVWTIGDLTVNTKGEGNGDYSFDGCDTITFKNMTLTAVSEVSNNYRGFIRIKNTVVEGCTINGMTTYWGYETAQFENVTFNAPGEDYALWIYSTPSVSITNCNFNIAGKGIHVYNEGGYTEPVKVELNNCTITSTKDNKAFVNIKNSNLPCELTLSGDNKMTINGVEAAVEKFYQVQTTEVTETSGKPVTVQTKATDGTLTTIYAVKAEETSTAVAKIGDTSYDTLDAALAYLTSLKQEDLEFDASLYALTLSNDSVWTEAPVYWAAGEQHGYVATLTDALTAAYKANAGKITIVCRPGADVGTMTHGHVADNITIFGNKAYVSSGECDLEVDTYKFSRETGKQDNNGDYLKNNVTILAYQLDNLGVWGQRNTDNIVAVSLVDCDSVNGITAQRVYISGTSGKNAIVVTDCEFETAATAIYSNADGRVEVYNCTFKNSKVPVNINHKAAGKMIVDMQKCTFTKCGDAGEWKQFAAPVRFVNSGSGTMETGVRETTFTDTVGTNGDILLGDGRTGQQSNNVSLYVSGTNASIQAQKPGYYNGTGTDATKKAATKVTSSETLDTSVETLLSATTTGDGTEANPYTLAQLGAMTRAEYIAAQERLGGTMYVTVGDYSYDTNGVLGNGVRNDTPGQTPDHSKLNAYGENGYLGEKNDGANGKSIVFVGGSITSGVTGYASIDNIGTSLLLAVPAYTNVTFKGITFNNVMSFNYQLYTSPWSQLGELKFDGCTFNGIIVGAIAAQTLTFNGCEFKNYTNTTDANSSNPTWIRPAYGNWTKDDNEGQGGNFKSLTTINFTDNTVTSTRPVKFEFISQWDITSTVTATGNYFDISKQAKDTAIKNVGLYFGAHTDANAFNLVAENNTKSTNTAALYTIPEGKTSLPLGSTVKNLAGEPVELTDALKWKAGDAAADKIVLKTVEAVASIGGNKYISLAAAIAAANNGDTVTLLKNVTENVEIAKEKNLTLDLNGCILNGGTGTAKAALTNYGTITIKDSSASKAGTIKRDDKGTTGETSYYVIRNRGTMTIESGTVINNSGYKQASSIGSMNGSSLICNGDCDEGGTLTIKGGTFTQNNFIAIKNGALGVLHVTGGTITSNHSAIQNWFKADITGGEIKGQLWTDAWKEGESVGETKIGGNAKFTGEIVMDITGKVAPTLAINGGNLNVTNWRITTAAAKAGAKPAVSGGTFTSAVPENYCADGFIPTANADGTFGVKEGAYVAQIGDVKYETLQAAIDAVKADETIYVLGNVDLGTDKLSTYDVKTTVKNVTIDLNGYTVTSAGQYTVYLKVNGWTIQNGTIRNTNASTTYGTLYVGGSSNSTTLRNLTVESETNGVQFAIASSKNGIKASITVEDGTKISGKYGVYMKGQPKPWSSTRDGQEILNLNGGEITGTTAAIAVFGAAKGNTKAGVIVNINGGKVYSDSYAIAGNGSSVLENTTINISGGKVFSNKDTAIYHPQAGTVTISGGEVYGVTGGVQMCAGTLNVTGGTISATGNGDVSGKTGDGSIPDGAAVSIVNRAYPAGAPTMTISGGTFTSAAGVGAVQAYGWKNNSQQTWDKPNASVSGGTFTSAVPANYCAEGFIPTDNGDGTFGVKEGTYVAEVNGVKYESLQAAINAASRNATVTMLADTRENVTINKAMTLDLNGFTLNGGTVAGKPALTITARTVTIKDSSTAQNGTIMREDTAENSGVSSHYVIDIQGNAWVMFESGNVKNGSGVVGVKGASLVRVGDDSVDKYPGLNIKGGTFTQDNFIVIKVDRGDLFLNGGTLNSANTYAVENWFRATIKGGTVNGAVSSWTYSAGSNSTLTISGGTVNGDVTSVNYGNAEGKKATVAITGGTINGELDTRSYNPTTGELTSITDAAKATIKITGGTFSSDPTKYVVEDSSVTKNEDDTYGVAKAYLATVGATSYYTMDEAFKAQTASGEPIVMLRDYTTGSPFHSGSINRTVDLNGHTWTCTGTDANSAAFEINYPDAMLTVKNGKVVSSQLVGLIPSAMGGTIKYDNSSLVFESVKMTTTANSGIETNGNNTNDTVTLRNSTLNVPNGFGIYFPSSGTLTIDNSQITAKTMGVQVCAGSLNINEGSAITVTGDAVSKTENDGAIQDGAAISIVNRTGYKGLDKIEVTGGKFKSNGTNAAIKAYDWDNTNKVEKTFTANDKVAVSGGTFSSAVKEEYCAPGYIPTTNSDGTYGVKEGVYVAKVDNVKYETLQAAINAAKGGSTVRLLANVTLTETAVFPAGKTVHLNLVGHSITATGTALRINGKTDIQSTDGVGTIESTGNVAVAVGNNASLTVYSGTLKGREGAVITGTSTGAKIEIRKNATLIATDNAVIAGNGSQRDGNPNTILVKGGTFIGDIVTTGYIACGIYAPWNDNVTVSGGTFNITNGAGIVARAGTVKVTGGTFNCGDGTAKGWVGDSKNKVPCAALVFDKAANYPALTDASQILVSGGTFSTDPAANGATLATGYVANKDESGMYKVAKANPVAAIGDVKYDTLQAAITAAQDTKDGATITLLTDINTSSYYEVKGENPVTIDLAGHNITGSGISGLFYVTVKGDLTIKGEGTVTAVEDNKAAMAVWVRSSFAKVTLEGGTYTQQITNTADPHFDLIYVERGNVYVKGGTYEGFTPDWTLNCKDENYLSKEANIEVTGGTFVGFDPANNKAEGEGTSFVPAGYVSTKGADGKFVVTEVKVAEVNGKQYGTLAEAVEAAKNGDTVKLLTDIDTPKISYTISKSLTIDLNGKTVTGDGYDAVFQINNADAKVLIKNGNIVAVENTGSAGKYAMAVWACEAECEVTLENLNVSQKITHTDDKQMDMIYTSGGTIIINSGNFVSGTPAWTLNCKDAAYKAGTANIIVKGGTFTGFDPANNKAEGENTNFVAAGYMSKNNGDGTYTVIVNEAVVAVIGDKEYETLAAATTAAKAGDTIVLVADADEANNFVQISANITLDLAGHSVTALYFYVTGTVKDTAAATDRGIVKAKMYAMFDNAYTPVYDSAKDGYSFFDLSVQTMWQSATSQYIFALKWTTEGQEALKLMLANDKTRRVQAQVTFSWVGKTGPGGQFFTFNDKTMSDYLTDGYRVALRATAQGLTELQQSVGQIEVQAKFVILDANGYELYTLLSDPTEIK